MNHYFARMGHHHILKPYDDFHRDLQEDPLAFKWEYSEDNSDSREFEESLLALYVGNEWCYNTTKNPYGFDKETAQKANAAIKDRSRSKSTRSKMRESALKTSAQRSEVLTKIANSKEPCPNCGKLMNPGNLKQHLRAKTCKRK